MRITDDTIIYIVCPGAAKTGGPDALHQLCHNLREMGYNAAMAYYGMGDKDPLVEEYAKYNTVQAKEVIDSPNNIIVFPEHVTYQMKYFKEIQKAIWWLSVDFYYHSMYRCGGDCYRLLEPDKDVVHLVNSEYARQHLLLFNVPEHMIFNVTDNPRAPFNGTLTRGDHVLYNPLKGLPFTKKIIAHCPDIEFVPIQDLTGEQVNMLFAMSKLYIDFGSHPGPERLPREAVLNGCCVIYGLNGSGKYYEDIPIDSQYKFANDERNIPLIADKIRECLAGYEEHVKNFEYFRTWCMGLEERFIQGIERWLKGEN